MSVARAVAALSHGASVRHAPLVAFVAAALALVAASVAAVGPAHEHRAAYAWPPSALPDTRPPAGWYAPLALLNRVPEAMEIRLPCRLSPALEASRAVTVLATARDRDTPALRVMLVGRAMRIIVGDRERARLPWPAACPAIIHVAGGSLRLQRTVMPLRLGTLDDMPIVTGLFSSLDLSRGSPLQVSVVTRPFDTEFTALQTVAAALAFALGLVALGIAARVRLRLRSVRRLPGRIWKARDPTDVVVLGMVSLWWIIAPVFTDDGWVAAEARALKSLGELSVLYDIWGLTSPVGYWLQALTQWVVGTTTDLVVMRIPSLIAVTGAWLLARWCLRVALGQPAPRLVRWALAGSFLLGAVAWEMTVRPEPFLSLLGLWALGATLLFVRTPSTAALAFSAPPIVLALAAHPAGIVTAAPTLAAAPAIIRWLRGGGRTVAMGLAVVVVAAAALGLTLFVLDSDLGSRVAAARVFQEADRHNVPPWREYLRYEQFDEYGGGSVGRRLSLALLLVPVLAWLFRPRRRNDAILPEAARAVAIGLFLLAFVSSKWPWHFGTLAPLGAVAMGSEAGRLALVPAARTHIVSLVAMLGVAVLWAWRAPDGWSPLDLQRLEWSDGFNGWTLAALIFVGATWFALAALRLRIPASAALSLLPAAIVAVASLGVVTLTSALLVVDAARSPWSPARQNLEALGGRESCGVAHHLRGDPRVSRLLAGDRSTLLAPAVAPYLPCATPPKIAGGVLELPTLFAYQSDPWPIAEPDGPYAAVVDLYPLRTLARGEQGIEIQAVDARVPGFRRVQVTRIVVPAKLRLETRAR